MLLLKQNTIGKKQVNELLKLKPKLNTRKNKEYKIETMKDSVVYTSERKCELSRLYYLLSLKSYSKDDNTWKLALIVIYL